MGKGKADGGRLVFGITKGMIDGEMEEGWCGQVGGESNSSFH